MVKMASQGDNEKEREDAAARCVQYIVQFYGVLKTHFGLSKHSGWFFLSLNLYATVKKHSTYGTDHLGSRCVLYQSHFK